MTTQFIYQGKGVEYWQAQFGMPATFDALVTAVQRKLGLSRGAAIQFARKVSPTKYNEHMKAKHPKINKLDSRGEREIQHFTARSSVLGMRTRSGVPFVKLIGA